MTEKTERNKMSLTHLQLIAIEEFAKKLKIDFPVLLKPKDFSDRLMNIANEVALKRIDLAVEWAKLEFDKEALKEAKHYGKQLSKS